MGKRRFTVPWPQQDHSYCRCANTVLTLWSIKLQFCGSLWHRWSRFAAPHSRVSVGTGGKTNVRHEGGAIGQRQQSRFSSVIAGEWSLGWHWYKKATGCVRAWAQLNVVF